MNCDRIQLLLNGYVDGELDLLNSLEIEEHLQGCATCSQRYKELSALHTITSNSALYYPATVSLEKRIHASLRKANPSRRPWLDFQWRWLTPAAGLLVLFMLAVVSLSRGWLTPHPDARLVEQVESAHVRSLVTNHLTDVISSDQHTVKPWFNGKLDFSPPVVNLAAEGYPLIGGRLDYLDGRAVAALVFQRNKHEINLFVWPTTNKSQDFQSSNFNGFNLYHWNQSGMTYWAVSDLNTAELQSFVELVQANFK
jgi:anti-sigma factor RsiW